MAYHIDNSDPGHARLKQQLENNVKITFVISFKNAAEKKKEKKIMAVAKVFVLHEKAIRREVGDDLSVCVLQKTHLIL